MGLFKAFKKRRSEANEKATQEKLLHWLESLTPKEWENIVLVMDRVGVMGTDPIIPRSYITTQDLYSYIEYCNNFNILPPWQWISAQHLELGFIDKHANLLNWDTLSATSFMPLSNSLLMKFKDRLNWTLVWRYASFDKPIDDLIDKFEDVVDFRMVSQYRKLSEPCMRKYKDKLDWYSLSIEQEMSEEFILEMKDYINLYNILAFQKCSDAFKLKLQKLLSE